MEEGTERLNFIPCVRWVKKGVAAENPHKVTLTDEEMKEIIEQAGCEIKEDTQDMISDSDDDSEAEVNEHEAEETLNTDEDDEYNLKNYDKEGDDVGNLFGIGSLVVHDTSGKDPYVTLDDSDDSEKDDEIIKPDDNLVVVGHVSGDASVLEIYVHNEVEDSLYVHHDLILPVFPLCLEWLSYDPGEQKPGNLCAVGSMSPIIDVWDLDIIDSLEPAFRLGNKAKKKKGIKRHGHRDAVLDITWNTHLPHILASGSVDQTVLLWDLDNGKAATTLTQFCEKVTSVKWHPFESQLLLTGCCDKLARVYDCRIDDCFKAWELEGEVERVLWNHFNPFQFLAGTESGTVYCVDCRNEKAIWQLAAHHGEVAGLSLSCSCPGLLVTAGSDKKVCVWDISEDTPVHVAEKTYNMGAIQCLDACPDAPFLFCVGGEKSDCNFRVLDLMQYSTVEKRFSSRPLLQAVPEKESDSTEAKTETEEGSVGKKSSSGTLFSSVSNKASKSMFSKSETEETMDVSETPVTALAALSLDNTTTWEKPSTSYKPGSAKKKGLKSKKRKR
ncbi:periodic tryptophan protein 1 homolog [Schistocerca piceifrons]|uniref:periodic tryptophan protein 1 homolog n=1 Tax=Schistocerca piceifrons TaxID=274613 RepID=UPI001F5FA398|nr:periodic tryptophan protein 1 homolog [Schistocerca piceifrons]